MTVSAAADDAIGRSPLPAPALYAGIETAPGRPGAVQAPMDGVAPTRRPPAGDLDRHPHHGAPLGPRAVVVADAREAEQLVQHEPRERRPLADPAVRDDVVAASTPLAAYRAVSSSALLNVPSSRTCWAHGIEAAPGMWPARCAVSVMPGGAMTSPLNSAGLRTSTSVRPASPMRGRMSSRNARRAESASGARSRLGIGGHVGRQRQVVVEPELAPAVDQPRVRVPVQCSCQ